MCGRSYCDARSLRRHIDNYHARPLNAAAALATSVPTASSEGGMALPELPTTAEQLPFNSMSSVSDDEESRQLAHLAAYE